jgi:HAD superfamily hydrolase (TIGR01509 family)
MIRGIFFDLDGTLVDTYKADFLAYRAAMSEVLDIKITEKEFTKTHGQEARQKIAYLAPGTSEDDLKKIAVAKKKYYPKYIRLTKPNKKLISFLAEYAEHNSIVLVTTAKRDNALAVLKKHKLEKYFSHLVFGDEVDKPKPDPESYNLALERSGLKPQEVIAFEDSDSGIAAAEAAGIAVVRVKQFATEQRPLTLKKFLIIPLLISLGIFIHFSREVNNSFHTLAQQLHLTSGFALVLFFAILLQLAGHIVQAKKAEYLFEAVKGNTTRFQFRALSIGYLFNALLPLRLGELIRARILAGGMDLSFSFAFSLIIVERAIDTAILGLSGLLILAIAGAVNSPLIYYIIISLCIAALIGLLIFVAVKRNAYLLKWLYHITGVFRENIKNLLRFKIWSVIYGLQRTLQPKRLIRYVGLSLLSWALYISSVILLVQYFFPNLNPGEKLLATLAPYYGLAIPSGPANLGVFSTVTNIFTQSHNLSADQQLVYNLITWGVLIIPISLVGFVLLFVKTKETLWRRVPQGSSAAALENKLYRMEDISQEMSRFLENYFSGNTLSHIVHRLELRENFRLLKYFKGGSDAITILAHQNGQEIVKKIIPPEFEDRLKAQNNWLKSHQYDGIVKLLGEEKASDHYAINLEYRSDDVMLFDYMHQNPLTKSTKALDEIWDYLLKYVHNNPAKLQLHAKERDQYIEKHIFGCLEKAAKVDSDLLRVVEAERVLINGHEYDNIYQIMEKIKNHPKAWRDIATYQETKEVHGDVAIDNILISLSDGRALLIDPAPDGNIINGPVFDFGKNMQSLYCGYEFLLRDDDPVLLVGGNIINYRSHSSAQYTQLCEYVRTKLAPKHLSKAEQRAIIFHAAALHIRRLKHQVYYNPANTLKFYAVGVKTLNEFLVQYDKL